MNKLMIIMMVVGMNVVVVRMYECGSGVPVPIHVDPSQLEHNIPPDLIEAAVGLVVEADQVSVSAIAERSICRLLALTHLIVPTFVDVETHWSAASRGLVAHRVAEGTRDTDATGTPVIHLPTLQIDVVGPVT